MDRYICWWPKLQAPIYAIPPTTAITNYAIGLETNAFHWCSNGSKFVTDNSAYWAIQAGLLIPLTFARYRLSPLAAFTSGAYFLHNGMRWQWILEFYTANFKGVLGGP